MGLQISDTLPRRQGFGSEGKAGEWDMSFAFQPGGTEWEHARHCPGCRASLLTASQEVTAAVLWFNVVPFCSVHLKPVEVVTKRSPELGH